MARRVIGAVRHCAHIRIACCGYGAIGVALGAGEHSADHQTYQNDDAALHLARKITQPEHQGRYRAETIPVEFAEEINECSRIPVGWMRWRGPC